ncbi:MAG: hypothetical protein AB2697_21645 [Candidatus Thiodiazotropha endolucinida]
MRKVASYTFSRPVEKDSLEKELATLDGVVKEWLETKGHIDSKKYALILNDRREAEFVESMTISANGKLHEYRLTEPTDTGLFQTAILFGYDGSNLSVYAELRAGGGLNQLAPVQFDIRCPHVIRSIIDSSDSWAISETPLTTSFVPFSGDRGAQSFIQILFHPSRNLPLVAVSTYEGSVLSENIASNIAKDLSGLAIVAVLDEKASWYLTNAKGKEWSCYNGAIRLYWPIRDQSAEPYAHPLWTRFSLLSGVFDVRDASYRIRKILRRRVLGASAFSVWEPESFSAIRKESRKEELARLTEHAETTDDWKEIADSYAKDNDGLQGKIDELNSDLSELRAQVSNLQLALQWQGKGEDEIEAAEDIPPTTVADAVEKAREKFPQTLIFGENVNDGIETLAQDAGPPEKIFQYLELLSQMAESSKHGSLGTTAIQWLKDRGANCSGESETIKNSKAEKEKRTWKDGKDSRVFDTHMKPSDATAPDRCARIYFDVEAENNTVVIGWVGRHP